MTHHNDVVQYVERTLLHRAIQANTTTIQGSDCTPLDSVLKLHTFCMILLRHEHSTELSRGRESAQGRTQKGPAQERERERVIEFTNAELSSMHTLLPR